MMSLLFALGILLGAPPPGPVTVVLSRGKPQVRREVTRVVLTTGAGERLKVLWRADAVLSLSPSTAVRLYGDRTIEVLGGTVEVAIVTSGGLGVLHEGLRFHAAPGVLVLTVSDAAHRYYYEKAPDPQKPVLVEGRKPVRALDPPASKPARRMALGRELCVLGGRLALHLKGTWCGSPKGQCLADLTDDTCLVGGDPPSSTPALQLPRLTATVPPLDFIALLPSLSRTLGGGPGKAESESAAVSGQGGSMCLDSSAGGGSAGDVGQGGSQTVKPLPTTRVTLRIVFR